MTLVIAILMKDPADAKTRLATALSQQQRERLALRMFENTLTFFRSFVPATPLLVVTPSDRISRIARHAGANVVHDDANGDINAAACCARDWAIAAGATALTLVHADIPILRQREFDTFLDACEDHKVVIATSVDGGTNAIFVTPPDAIPFAFGPGSAEKHAGAARSKGLAVKTVSAFFMSRDIDHPQDLRLCSRVLAWQRPVSSRLLS